ncbi:MAG: 4Fe-4S dicluster domain-containing protein [Syntrophaceae bacterium]|nr:4Fe-4S dicluster domain-containing protein [Syntrophaceae bacterium]
MTPSPPKKAAREILIDVQTCKGCNLCVEVCPRKVFAQGDRRSRSGYSMPAVAAPEKCSVCFLCEMTCPDLAITLIEENP